jgi:beta-apo-4'-carotenal oxygenase
MDQATRFLEPTVVKVEDPADPLIQEETFGPITSLVPVDDLDQAIRIANEVDATPLGCYPFGSRAETDRVLAELRSGGASVNDGFFHGAIPTLQFGGVGSSGQGAYRGRASFDCFSHRRSIVRTPGWMEGLLAVRYPPYTSDKLAQFQKMNNARPDFGRDGRVTRAGWLRWLLTLGGGTVTGGLARYVLVLIGT